MYSSQIIVYFTKFQFCECLVRLFVDQLTNFECRSYTDKMEINCISGMYIVLEAKDKACQVQQLAEDQKFYNMNIRMTFKNLKQFCEF